MKLMTDKEYKSEILFEQTNPGKICIVKGLTTQIAFKVGLSYKLSKGTVKINDIDLAKIGIGLIDNVAITPSGKENGGKKLILMSYSQTKYPAGMVVMNIQDAKSLGLSEKDTVYVIKADLIKNGDRYGNKLGRKITSRPENMDIDDEFDFCIAEKILEGGLA